MNKVTKISAIAIKDIVVNRAENVRENNDERYSLGNLMEDIALQGQIDPITVEKKGDKYYPIRGFRRSEALQALATAKRVDPKTGKPFEIAEAVVYEGLTPQDRVKLLLDHSQRQNLNKLELFYAFVKTLEVGYSERDTVVVLRGLLEMHHPPSRSIVESYKDNGKDLLDYYKGVLQTAKLAWLAPTVLRRAYERKLSGKPNWPSNAELRELCKVYDTEKAKDTANKYNRDNPGPEFMKRWNEFIAKKSEDEANGEKRAKADSMMNRSQVEDIKKQTKSRLLMTFNDIITRRISADKLPVLDEVAVALEKYLATDTDASKKFDSIFAEAK